MEAGPKSMVTSQLSNGAIIAITVAVNLFGAVKTKVCLK